MIPHTGTAAPRRAKTVVVTWLAIFPLVTAVLAAGTPLGLAELSLVLRSLVLTAIVVPTAVLVVLPLLRRLLGQWLATEASPARTSDSTRVASRPCSRARRSKKPSSLA